MPRYSRYGMSPIQRRTPIGLNVEAFADAVGKLDAKYQAMAQQQSAIDMALAQLPVNSAEDEWRYNLSNEIRSQIESVDNPNDRYLASIKAAGNIMNRPDVIGRIKAQAEYDNFVKQTQARKDIGQDVKDWALANNQYHYEDKFDAIGNIIGGSEWKPNVTPVTTVPLSDIGEKALSWIKANVKNIDDAVFVGEDYKPTTDINKAIGVISQRSGSITELSKEKIQEAVNAAIDMTDGARASIDQDYKVENWKYDKLSPEEKATIGVTPVTDINGRKLTKEEYLENRLSHFYNAVPYKNVDYKTSYGTGLTEMFAHKQQVAAAEQAAVMSSMSGVNFTGTGYNVTYDTTDYINQAKGDLEDAIASIEGAMPQFKNSKAFQDAKIKGDYDAIERLVRTTVTKNGKNYYDISNNNVKNIVDRALLNIYNNKGFVTETYSGLSQINKDALEARTAIDTGNIPSKNNKFFKDFNALLNRISNGKPAESYQIRFNSEKDKQMMLDAMGMDIAKAKSIGIDFGTEDDKQTATIKANNGYLPKMLLALSQGRDDLFRLPGKETVVRALGQNNEVLGWSARGNIIQSAFGGPLSLMDSLNTSIDTHVGEIKHSTSNLRTTDQLTSTDIPAIADARRDYGADSAEFARVKKDIEDSLARALAQSDFTQLGIYNVNDDTNTLTITGNKNRGEIAPEIISYIQDGKANIGLGTSGVLTGYTVTTYGKRDKNGDIIEGSKPQTIFITSGINDEALAKFKADTATRAIREYNRRRSIGGTYKTYLGDILENMGNDSVIINGHRGGSPQDAYNIIETDKLIDDTVNYCKSINLKTEQGKALADDRIQKMAIVIAAKVGKQNDSAYIAKVYNTIYKQL